MVDNGDREVWNRLRVDLYRRLLPKIQEKDQASGTIGFTVHWDDPDPFWNSGDPKVVWNALGVTPVIQELFYVIEKFAGEDIEALEALDTLVDPLRCPVDLLPNIAASFGYRLEDKLDEKTKRIAVLGLVNAFKSRGTFAGFKVFYRLLGFDLIRVVPLWKKDVNEANNDYSAKQFRTTSKTLTLGASGTSFAGTLPDVPIKPGTLRIAAGGVVLRDEPPETMIEQGTIIGPGSESGTIDYNTGEYRLTLSAPAVPVATWEHILERWPYHAARIDIEVQLNPGGSVIPLVDAEAVDGLLNRLEETRPVHVLLRTLALIVDLDDEMTPAATDKAACVVQLDDRRSNSTREYILDAASVPSDEALLEYGASPVREVHMEDHGAGPCPLDTLKIETIPGSVMWW